MVAKRFPSTRDYQEHLSFLVDHSNCTPLSLLYKGKRPHRAERCGPVAMPLEHDCHSKRGQDPAYVIAKSPVLGCIASEEQAHRIVSGEGGDQGA